MLFELVSNHNVPGRERSRALETLGLFNDAKLPEAIKLALTDDDRGVRVTAGTMSERDHHLETAARDLRKRAEELDTLTLAEKRRGEEGLQRQDEVVRRRDATLLREQSARLKPAIGKPASTRVKKRRNNK